VVVVSILDEVQTKSRFVRQSDGQWFEVEAHVAKEKVCCNKELEGKFWHLLDSLTLAMLVYFRCGVVQIGQG